MLMSVIIVILMFVYIIQIFVRINVCVCGCVRVNSFTRIYYRRVYIMNISAICMYAVRGASVKKPLEICK